MNEDKGRFGGFADVMKSLRFIRGKISMARKCMTAPGAVS
jgi:hypothetical protein